MACITSFFSATLSLSLCTGSLWLRRVGATLEFRCASFSLLWLLLLWRTGSSSSSGGMWDPAKAGTECVSPASSGRFLTSGLPGKPCCGIYNIVSEVQQCPPDRWCWLSLPSAESDMASASPHGITASRLCSHVREKLVTTVLTCISVQRGLKIFSHVVGTYDKLLLPVFFCRF